MTASSDTDLEEFEAMPHIESDSDQENDQVQIGESYASDEATSDEDAVILSTDSESGTDDDTYSLRDELSSWIDKH